jgi:hypothetical protein
MIVWFPLICARIDEYRFLLEAGHEERAGEDKKSRVSPTQHH